MSINKNTLFIFTNIYKTLIFNCLYRLVLSIPFKCPLWAFILLFILAFLGCKDKIDVTQTKDHLFELTEPLDTGIDFVNQLQYDKDFNVYTYRNYYNGGGVAIGDINNDGLADIYFTSNLGENKLYLNKSDFKFEDITATAGVGGTRSWSTGVTMVDINADGWLDIYVSNSGDIKGGNTENELFINNGDNTFSEMAEKYGLADEGLSTQAVFFDYDHDGDLDVYVLNNSFKAIGSFNLQQTERQTRDQFGGDKLYRNNGGKFEDVSEMAGIYGSVIGFGLGVAVTDLDNDGWDDIYVCNDFFERDYVYMNNGDGTFREELTKQMRSISMASMGVDAADLNHDGLPDLFVTEMLPKSEERLKTSMTFENWDKFRFNVKHGYFNQFTRNMLQVNNGFTSENAISFSERSRQSGVEATDWSWAVLLADFNLDTHRDIYISNGVNKDILNQDYLNYISSDVVIQSMVTEKGVNYKKLIDIIPTQPISNFAYSGDSKLNFKDVTEEWGLSIPGFSNGVAYGDLDNDGDLDLVVNNVNMNAFVYKNLTKEKFPDRNFLKIQLIGEGQNSKAIGAKVFVFQNGSVQMAEQNPTRGFQSSVDFNIHFGIAQNTAIDSVLVRWTTGQESVVKDIVPNKILVLNENELAKRKKSKITFSEENSSFGFEEMNGILPDNFSHRENVYSDFDKDAMLFHMNSTEGPKIAVGDVNGDGLEDIFICGAKDFPGILLFQNKNEKFTLQNSLAFENDKRSEDVDAKFFDADNDGDLDLYVVSGGNEYPSSSSALSDRLYFNDGKGNFTKSSQLLPTSKFESTSCVEIADYDGDGDLDIFVGVRLKDRMYGLPQNGYILQNDGKGVFTNVSDIIAPELHNLGLIKDVVWTDFNGDGLLDMIVIGEWMAIEFFRNNGKTFERMTDKFGLSGDTGWWNTIEIADVDNDGDPDYILGNHGLNSRFRASHEKPILNYISDFDENGTLEQIICTYNGEVAYPMALRHDITKQLPYLKKQFLLYEDYKLKQVTDIFSEQQLENALKQKATFLESAILLNNGSDGFQLIPLPAEAQVAPVYAIHISDFNHDGFPDILLGGNLLDVKPEVGQYDASYGVCLLGDGKGAFKAIGNNKINLMLQGQIRDIKSITIGQKKVWLVAGNNSKVRLLQLKISETESKP